MIPKIVDCCPEFATQDNILSSLKRSWADIKVIDQGGMYFVSFAVVGWVDVFSRKEYRDLVIESLKYCQEKKVLVIYVWCIMSNHVHLIISAKESNVSDVLGDFKKFYEQANFKGNH